MLIKTTKFKTQVISLRFKDIIQRETIGLRALLPQVMTASSPLFNSRIKLNEALDDLYGASLDARTYKQGKLSIVAFTISFISPKFIDEPLLENVLKLLKDVVYGHKKLSKSEFELEKRQAIEKIMAFENDKTSYALSRLFDVMFEDDYRLRPLGTIQDIEAVTYADLNHYYPRFLETGPDILLSGDFSETEVQLINHYFKPKDNPLHPVDLVDKTPHYQEVKETDHINQVKLNIGYVLPVGTEPDTYYKAIMFNLIFGGAVHSRLFLNVREKHSLCYYISSSYDPYKRFIYVYAGVDKFRVDLALRVIDEQLKDLQDNLITPDELVMTKQVYINLLKEQEDHQHRQMDVYYMRKLLGIEALDEAIKKINNVSLDDINVIAKRVVKDTLYLLMPEDVK